MLHGYWPVVAHAHAYFLEMRVAGKVLVAQSEEGVVYELKLASHLFHVAGEGGHRHR